MFTFRSHVCCVVSLLSRALCQASDRAYRAEFEMEQKPLMQAGARVQRLEKKLVNAEYCCELFAHVPWPNGDIMHVTVSPEGYRLYEERMQAALGALKRRYAGPGHFGLPLTLGSSTFDPLTNKQYSPVLETIV